MTADFICYLQQIVPGGRQATFIKTYMFACLLSVILFFTFFAPL